MKTVHVKVSGKVQGVWFRASTKQEAEKNGINGWVKNTSNGCVEAVFQGDEQKIMDIIDWCYKGPPLSAVEHVDVKEIDTEDKYESFSMRY